jgi:hypothetical protein
LLKRRPLRIRRLDERRAGHGVLEWWRGVHEASLRGMVVVSGEGRKTTRGKGSRFDLCFDSVDRGNALQRPPHPHPSPSFQHDRRPDSSPRLSTLSQRTFLKMDDGTELVEAYGNLSLPSRSSSLSSGLTHTFLSIDFLCKMIIIGEAGTGKSCLLHHFIQSTCPSASPPPSSALLPFLAD